MYARLKKFVTDRKAGETSSTFYNRFQFFRKKSNRDNCILNLEKWRCRLERVIEINKHKDSPVPAQPQSKLAYNEIRTLFEAFVQAAANNWDCSCHLGHEAMLCLKYWPTSVLDSAPSSLEFDFLFSNGSQGQNQLRWYEGRLIVQKQR
jgi:hypothetical protein